MRKFNYNSMGVVLAVLFCLGCLDVGAAERSFIQRFANFFTPSGSIKGEGPVFEELKGVEAQIDKLEVKYSRERRPGNKNRYRDELDSLRNVRDSLVTVLEKMQEAGSSSSISSSTAQVVVKTNVAFSSANASSSSAMISSAVESALSSKIAESSSSVNVACVRDTVFVHDTLIVRDTIVFHDTLYVVLANKPEKSLKNTSKNKKKSTSDSVK